MASCWVVVMLWSRYVTKGAISRNQCLQFSWIFGLWGLVERVSRQAELAQYILSHALYALYMRFKKQGILDRNSQHQAFFALLLAGGVGPWMAGAGKPGLVWKSLFGDL